MKKLLALVVVGGLFGFGAIGCGPSASTAPDTHKAEVKDKDKASTDKASVEVKEKDKGTATSDKDKKDK